MRWMVFNSRMDVIGTVYADGYTEAFIIAKRKFRYVEYIQKMWEIPHHGGCGGGKVWYFLRKEKEDDSQGSQGFDDSR